jgi:hypothetical protein
MKTTDTAATNEDTLATIEAVALDNVTGGCAACGQDCANGRAPANDSARQAGTVGASQAR